MNEKNLREIELHAHEMRKNIVRITATASSGHPGGSLGQADIFATLYFGRFFDDFLRKTGRDFVLNFSRKPLNLLSENRDILVQSNGHTAPARYAVFRELGFFTDKEMLTLRKFGSRLQGHPERKFLPEIETTSGPLGEGLSQGAGMALGLKKLGQNSRKIFVTLGDGELDEGQNWEAIMFAAKSRLANLIAIVDFNGVQLSGKIREIMPLEPLAGKFASFGWEVFICDGNSPRELLENFAKILSGKSQKNGKPKVLLAKTKMGAGIPSIENDFRWHGKAPDAKTAEKWLKELDENFMKKEKK